MSLTLLLLTTLLLQGPAFPWGLFPEESGQFSQAEKTRVEALAAKEFCYWGCKKTVAACLTGEKPDPTAKRMAGIILRLVRLGKTDEEVSRELANRARSAHPFSLAQLDLTDAPRLGPEDAKLKVVLFGDLDCPYCRVVSPRVKKLVEASGGKLALYFKVFPLKLHGDIAIMTSSAGLAAARQGKFWEFHDVMYADFFNHGRDAVLAKAAALGLDLKRFAQDFDGDTVREALKKSKREGLKLSVDSTPTIFINGKRYYGLKLESEIEDRIQEELELLGLPPVR